MMMTRLAFSSSTLLYIVVVLWLVPSSAALAELRISDQSGFWNASQEVRGYSGADQLNAAELLQLPDTFTALETFITYPGSPLWLRIDFSLDANDTSRHWNAVLSLLPYETLSANLYQSLDSELVAIRATNPAAHAQWLGAKQIIPLGVLEQGNYILLLRLTGDLPLDLLYVTGLIDDHYLAAQTRQHDFLLAFYCGGLFVMFVYSLVLYIGLRHLSYLFYCLLNLAYFSLAFSEGGLVVEFLPGGSVQDRTDSIILSVAFIVLFAGFFLTTFVEQQFRRRWWVYPLVGTAVLYFVLSLPALYPVDIPQQLQTQVRGLAFLLSQFFVVVGMSYAAWLGSRAGWVALLAIVVPVTISVLIGLMQFNIIEGSLFLQESIYLANLWEMLILSAGLLDQLRRMRRAREKAEILQRYSERAANTDALTGIANRRALFDQGEKMFLRLKNEEASLGVLMFDIDHFKEVNDDFGHRAGDDILCQVAARAVDSIRERDLVGRCGGEEFAVLLPHASNPEILNIAERLRQSVATIETPATDDIAARPVTVSIGVAMLTSDFESFIDILQAADEGLYTAKNRGRNNVACSGESEGSILNQDKAGVQL